MYGMRRSARIPPPPAPTERGSIVKDTRIAWGAYARRWLRAWLPPAFYTWLGRVRGIPALDMADTLITESTEGAAYFLVVARKMPSPYKAIG